MKSYFILFVLFANLLTAQNDIPLYVGTYTNGESEGIYYFDFNTKTGELTNKQLAVEAKSPSFLAISSNRKFLYAVSEAGAESGAINSYSIQENGLLSQINSVSSEGRGPCHVQLSENNNKLAVSNYGGGTIGLYNIEENGNIQKAFQVLNHNITNKKSHAHSAKFLDNELFIADLGRNFLAQYTLNNDEYVLRENYTMENGAGPRHFDISTNGTFIYAINELNSTISVLKKNDSLYSNIQNISTLKTSYTGKNACADIHLSQNGKFLYGSNRGENSIVVFEVNKEDGTLTKIQSISVNGDWPRNFSLSPNNNFLLVANQKSNNISVFTMDKKTGELEFSHTTSTDAPVCLRF